LGGTTTAAAMELGCQVNTEQASYAPEQLALVERRRAFLNRDIEMQFAQIRVALGPLVESMQFIRETDVKPSCVRLRYTDNESDLVDMALLDDFGLRVTKRGRNKAGMHFSDVEL
jgi:hypothetical protein